MSKQNDVRVPPIDIPTKNQPFDEKRLWIGNLDPRITEYQLLKILQKHGPIEKFDLLFHRNGPYAGQSRGYAFITYAKKEDAVKAMKILNNQLIGTKRVNITWAHCMVEVEKPKVDLNIPALAGGRTAKPISKEKQIQAIEDKLKMMEHKNNEDFEINKTVSTELPVIAQYQFNKPEISSTNSNTHQSTSLKNRSNHKRNAHNNKPYSNRRK